MPPASQTRATPTQQGEGWEGQKPPAMPRQSPEGSGPGADAVVPRCGGAAQVLLSWCNGGSSPPNTIARKRKCKAGSPPGYASGRGRTRSWHGLPVRRGPGWLAGQGCAPGLP